MMNEDNQPNSDEDSSNPTLKYVKPLIWNKYLPYDINDEADIYFLRIKNNLVKALIMRDMNGAELYCRRLNSFIRLYNLQFQKEDLIKLIRIFIEVICLPDLEPVRVNCFCSSVLVLFRKKYISPDDLEIDWKPFYELFLKYLHKSSKKGYFYSRYPLLQISISSVIQTSSTYFSPSSTKEILDLILPKLQPLDVGSNCQIFEIFNLFLNFHKGYDLWFNDFMKLWDIYHNPPWSEDMMVIMGNLAFENIGKIDWDKHLPVMFTRILRSLNLPVAYQNVRVNRYQQLSIPSIAKWIVSTLGPKTEGQKYLTIFIKTIESYIHPANMGKWTKPIGCLLDSLSEKFIKRLEIERFRKLYWKDDIPESYKLTENCITAFVESLKSAAFQAIYSRIDPNNIYKLFKHLSNLRPNLIIPEVVKRVYINLDLLTEPHRLTASYQSLLGVCKSLICGQNGYIESRSDVIPILFATLPGIDSNDLRKSFATMNFYGAFLFQIPIIDCSKISNYEEEISEPEAIICEQTSEFENFVLQYIDRLLILIKFASRENIRMEHGNDIEKTRNEMLVENSIASGFQAILGQCSDEILQSAARKVSDFVKFNILDSSSEAPLLGNLVHCIGLNAGNYVFKMLLPFLTEGLQSYLEEHPNACSYEKHSNEFLYYYTIFFYVFRSDTREVLKYLDTLISILDKLTQFKCLKTGKITRDIILYTLANFSQIQIFNVKSYDVKNNKDIPIKYWGKKMGPNDTIEFFIPGKEQRDACEIIIYRYLPPILEKFRKFYEENVFICREDILNSCYFVLSFLNIANFLPMWDEPTLNMYDSVVEEDRIQIKTLPEEFQIHMPDGSNVRLCVLNSIEKLLDKILNEYSDDIQSIKAIINILNRIHRPAFRGSYDTEIKAYNNIKDFQEEKLTEKRRDIKFVFCHRVLIQQTCRLESNMPNFTETHKKILLLLIKLGTSRYSAVRQLAQSKIENMFTIYPLSYRYVGDEIVKNLQLDPNEHHEAFKGTLHILTSNNTLRMKTLVKNDWYIVEKFWLNLLNSLPSEKLSIIRLIEYANKIITYEFMTITVSQDIPDSFISLVQNLNPNIPGIDVKKGKELLNERNKSNTECYYNILNGIIDSLSKESIHWRHHNLGTSMISVLGHPRVNYSYKVANFFINNLLNETVKERELSILILNAIMVQQKRKHLKINFNPLSQQSNNEMDSLNQKLPFGIRNDNMWLQYDLNTLPDTEAKWNQTKFVYKNDGFFGWSKDFKVYEPYEQQPCLDRDESQMSEIEKSLYNFLKNEKNVDKLFSFMALEETKEKEKFKRSRFILIKNIFREFGDTFFESFHSHIVKLIKDNAQPSNHRCAAEYLSGIMRGMKHWPFKKSENAYKVYIVPLVDLIFEYITTETDNFWGTCFATGCEKMDPRQQFWLYETLIKEPLREKGSFLDCSRIFILQGPFNQHVWRMATYSQRLLESIIPFLNNPYQNVRSRLGSLLINIFEYDVQLQSSPHPKCPLIKDMMDEVLQKLKLLNDNVRVNTELDEFKSEVCLYKTICAWITGNISKIMNSNKLAYFNLLPIACRYESYDRDVELGQVSSVFIGMLGQAMTAPDIIESAFEKIEEIAQSTSWTTRLSIIEALQVITFNNLMIALNNEKVVKIIQNIVFKLLEDNHINVREKAAEVLGGLLHCSFLKNTNDLIEQFRKKSEIRITISENNNTRNNDNTSLILRHSGVLGLCAFIAAFPYTLPDFLGQIFDILSKNLNDPQPIPCTIRKTVASFKRTHCNDSDWTNNKELFSDDQLSFLSDLTIPPMYYV